MRARVDGRFVPNLENVVAVAPVAHPVIRRGFHHHVVRPDAARLVAQVRYFVPGLVLVEVDQLVAHLANLLPESAGDGGHVVLIPVSPHQHALRIAGVAEVVAA